MEDWAGESGSMSSLQISSSRSVSGAGMLRRFLTVSYGSMRENSVKLEIRPFLLVNKS